MLGELIGAGISLIGGLFGANSADKAAKAQAEAMMHAANLQKRMFDTTRADMMPWLESGREALAAYMGELGMGGPGFKSTFAETPGYQFQVQQGEQGVLNNLSALGMRDSGAALKSLERFRQGLASQEYGNFMNRLASVSGLGQTQSNALANQAAGYANSAGNLIAGAGAARASGYVGGANALMGGLNSAANFIGQAFGGGGSSMAAPSVGTNYFHANPGLW